MKQSNSYLSNILFLTLGCPCQTSERNQGLDEEEEGEGSAGGQNLQVAVPNQLHPSQHCVLGPVW